MAWRSRTGILLLTGLALAASACTLATAPGTTSTSTSAPPASPTAIPIPGGGTVNPNDRLFVYTGAAGTSAAGGTSTATATASPATTASPTASPAATPQPAAVRTVYTYDLTQGKAVSKFDFGSSEDPAVRAELAGREVVTATMHHVTIQHLDGTVPREVYASPPTGEVLDIDVSPDGQLLAIIARSEASNPETAIVRVTYLASGGAALNLGIGDPRFSDFQGSFAQVHWQQTPAGGRPSFVVAGTVAQGHTPSVAVISVDGAVSTIHAAGIPWLAPGGTTWAMTDQLVCTGNVIAGHHLSVGPIGSSKIAWETTNTTPLYTPYEWSPDGKTLVYVEQPDSSGACKGTPAAGTSLFAVNLATGQSQAIADLQALHEQWYGTSLVTASCVTGALPVTDPWQHLAPLCPESSSHSPMTVMVGGTKIGQATDPIPVGFVAPAPSGSGTVAAA